MTAVTQRPEADEAAAEHHAWFPGWRPLISPAAAWATSRVLSFAAIAVGYHLRDQPDPVNQALRDWDGNWYLEAANGYDYPVVTADPIGTSDIAFFPVFPLLIRSVAAVTGWTPYAAGIFVTAVFGLLAIVAIWLLMNAISGPEVADRTAWLMAFFPGSIALTLIYSEGVMLAAVAACLLALVQRRWVLAGILGAVASASRPNGIAIAVACGVAALLAIHRDRDWRSLAAPALAPMGFVLYMAWLWAQTGSPTVWFRVQREGWYERIDWGRTQWGEITLWIPRLFTDLSFREIWLLHHVKVSGVLFIIVTLVLLYRWKPPAILVAYALPVIVLALISATLGARPRFIFTAFPLIAALAWSVRGLGYQVVLTSFAMLFGFMSIAYTTARVVVP
jgi:hypothetical protein